jgi:hypothetical protein
MKSSHECSQYGVSVHIECWEKFHDEEKPWQCAYIGFE